MTAVPVAPGGLRGFGELLKGLGAFMAGKTMSDLLDQVRDKTKEADCTDTPDATQCNQCKLKDGVIGPALGRRNINDKNIINYHYQIYIANLKSGPEIFGFCSNGNDEPLTDYDFSMASKVGKYFKGEKQLSNEQLNMLEWHYGSIEFDGFWRSVCTVVEAKGRFEGFINEEGKPKFGFTPKFFASWPVQMNSQKTIVGRTKPQGKLEWHFMEAKTCAAAKKIYGMDSTLCHFTPYILKPTQA